MIESESIYEHRIYAFLSKKDLEKKFPNDKDRQDREIASAGYISISKLTCKIDINYYQPSWSSEMVADFIIVLNRARNLADKFAEMPEAVSYRKNGY